MPINQEDLSENISIIVSTFVEILYLFPKKFFGFIVFISAILGFISSIFDYKKLDFATAFNWFSITNIAIILLLSISISLINGFYNYINKKKEEISDMKKSHLDTVNELKDKIESIKTQYDGKPTFTDKNLIENMIKEIENYVYVKNYPQIIEKYLPVIGIKRINGKIEISALNKEKYNLDQRMILKLYHRKTVLGYDVHDEYGLVSVVTRLDELIKVIVIDVQPEEQFWEKIFLNLKKDTLINCDKFYLKIDIPENILRTDVSALNNLIVGLKNYE